MIFKMAEKLLIGQIFTEYRGLTFLELGVLSIHVDVKVSGEVKRSCNIFQNQDIIWSLFL